MTSEVSNRNKWLLIKVGPEGTTFHVVAPGATTVNGEIQLCWVNDDGAVIALAGDEGITAHYIDDLLDAIARNNF